MITTIKRPYEFLARWREGKISGAHVGFEVTTMEDGKVISVAPLTVQPVDIGNGIGFPLRDILNDLSADALIRVGELEAEIRTAKETIDKQAEVLATVKTELAE